MCTLTCAYHTGHNWYGYYIGHDEYNRAIYHGVLPLQLLCWRLTPGKCVFVRILFREYLSERILLAYCLLAHIQNPALGSAHPIAPTCVQLTFCFMIIIIIINLEFWSINHVMVKSCNHDVLYCHVLKGDCEKRTIGIFAKACFNFDIWTRSVIF